MSLIAQALAGPGIRLQWDFFNEIPLRLLWPELAARGVPEDQWPVDGNDDGSGFYAGYFRTRYGACRSGWDTSSESDGESFELGQRPPNHRRLSRRRRLHTGWRFRFQVPAPVPRIHVAIDDRA